MCYVEAKGSTSDPDSNIVYRSNSKVTVTKSNKTWLAPKYIYTAAKICHSWHMFNCKKLFRLQIRPPSLILLITTSQDLWIFPSQSWEVKNSMMMIMMMMMIIIIIIIIIIMLETETWSRKSWEDFKIWRPHNRNWTYTGYESKIILVSIRKTGTISVTHRQYLSNILGQHDINEVPKKKQPYCALHTWLREVLM